MVELVPGEVDVAYEMVGIRQAIDLLELQFSRLAATFDKGAYWEQEGSNSPIDWIRFNCHLTSNAAGARIAVGENLGRMAESAQAMQAGEIGFAHLVELARTADAVGKAFDETKLLELARENSPGKFHYKCMHYRHSVDAKAVAEEQAELAETRFLHLNTQDDGGLFITGLLDPVGGALVRNALEPLARSSGADDFRDAPKRWADALVELASSKTRIQMQVTSSVETQPSGPPRRSRGRVPGRRDRVLPPNLLQDRRALGLRLEPEPDPDAGLGGDRRRPERADDQRPAAPGADRAGQALPVAGLRADGVKVRWTSRRALAARRRRRDRKPDPALPPASLDGA